MSKKKRRRQNRTSPAPQTRNVTAPSSAPEPEPAAPVLPSAPAPDHDGHVDVAQVQVLLELIAAGVLDHHLDAVEAAISDRRRDHHRAATHQAATGLHIGDRVRLTRDIRPQYLHGALGTIIGWVHTNAVVELDTPAGRFTDGQIRCPPLGLQKIPE